MRLLIFGMGYASRAIAARLEPQGWRVVGTTRDGRDGTIAFADHDRVRFEARQATAILSSVPPDADGDPVLAGYRDVLTGRTLAYLSSTGVYGDADGGWVDERAPITGRRRNRNAADAAWLALGARVFRLPGIYGPGRSPLDRVAAGEAHRVDRPGQVFSRVHVADIADGVARGLAAPEGRTTCPTICRRRRTTSSPMPRDCWGATRRPSLRSNRSARWRAPFMPRTGASRTAGQSGCSAGARPIPITGSACAP